MSPTLADLFPDTQGTPTIAQLAERFAELLEDVRPLAEPLYGRTLTAEALLSAPAATRAAYLRLSELSGTHVALRLAQAAHRREHRPTDPQADVAFWHNVYGTTPTHVGSFFDCRAYPEMSRGLVQPLPSNIARRGPAEPIARLLWLATDPEAEPWMPEPAAQDARFREFLAEIARRRLADHASDAARVVRIPSYGG